MLQTKKPRYFKRSSSILSLLNGLASKKDHDYVRLRHALNHGKYPDQLEAFIKKVPYNDDQNVDALWLESPYGAYTVIATTLPVDQRRFYQKIYKSPQIELKQAYALLFSPHSEFLEQALYPEDKRNIKIRDHEIESFVEVRSTYLEDDLVYTHPNRPDEKILDLSWVPKAVNDHAIGNEDRLRTHGKLTKVSDNMYRSGSTLLWFERNAKRRDKFDCYLYNNPAQGEDMLYVEEDMLYREGILNEWVYKPLLRLGAKKINHSIPSDTNKSASFVRKAWWLIVGQPHEQYLIDKDQRHEFARRSFQDISSKIMRHSDPYDFYKPASLRQKIGHTVKREGLRMTQKIVHDASKVDAQSLGITIVGTIAMYMALLLYKIAAAVVIRLAEFAARGVSSVFRAVSKYTMPAKSSTYSYMNDYSHLMAAKDDAKSFANKSTKGFFADSFFVKHSEFVPIEYLAALYPKAKPFTKEGEFQRIDSMLLDTTRYPIGTIISDVSYQDRAFLKIEQPDGITVYRDQEQNMALVPRPNKPIPGAYLDDSFVKRFDELGQDQNILAIKYTRQDGLQSSGFVTIEKAIESDFFAKEDVSINRIAEKVVDLSTTGKHKQFSVDDALYRHGQKPSEKGFLKRMAKRVFGPKDKHYDMPDLFEPLVCFNNAACKPIWPKIQPPAHIPNPRLLERRNEILRQARLNNQF